MIEIAVLERYNPDDLLRLVGGYVSEEHYAVRKSEGRERTVIALERASLAQPYVKRWTYQAEDNTRYRQMVAQDLCRGAYEGAELVGIALAEAQEWNRTLWIWEFGVAETHRRRGIGRRLMDEMVAVARREGLRRLLCETQSTNVPAIDFYRAVGFEIDAVNLFYYSNEDLNGEIAIFMGRGV